MDEKSELSARLSTIFVYCGDWSHECDRGIIVTTSLVQVQSENNRSTVCIHVYPGVSNQKHFHFINSSSNDNDNNKWLM